MLAYLAIYKGIWGPHLIIVPTSCLINWECELKRFAPAFKILTYYGTAKQRKALRVGWSRLNSFHVCITSYQVSPFFHVMHGCYCSVCAQLICMDVKGIVVARGYQWFPCSGDVSFLLHAVPCLLLTPSPHPHH